MPTRRSDHDRSFDAATAERPDVLRVIRHENEGQRALVPDPVRRDVQPLKDRLVTLAEFDQGPFAAPFVQSAEALFAVDSEQRVLAWNAAAVRLFGYSAAAVLGQQCFSLVACTDNDGRRFCRSNCAVMRSARIGVAPSPLQLRARVRGGDRLTVQVSTVALALAEAHGAVIHLCRPVDPIELSRAESPGRLPVTQREQQVLAALCRGETTDDMALGLGLTPTTVRNHVQHLLGKLGVHSRTELVAMAYRDGLLRQ